MADDIVIWHYIHNVEAWALRQIDISGLGKLTRPEIRLHNFKHYV